MTAEDEQKVAVTFALDATEAAGIEWAAPRVVGPRNFMVLHRVDTDTWELELRLDGDLGVVAGQERGVETFRVIRAEANLPAIDPLPLTGVFLFSIGGSDPSHDYIGDAEDFLDNQHFEYAVVAAQIACELEIRLTIDRLADQDEGLGLALAAVVQPSRLNSDKGGQALLAAAGHPINTMPWWPTYQAHVQRRHNVVHRGAKLTSKEATTSIEVMWHMTEFMRTVRATLA